MKYAIGQPRDIEEKQLLDMHANLHLICVENPMTPKGDIKELERYFLDTFYD